LTAAVGMHSPVSRSGAPNTFKQVVGAVYTAASSMAAVRVTEAIPEPTVADNAAGLGVTMYP